MKRLSIVVITVVLCVFLFGCDKRQKDVTSSIEQGLKESQKPATLAPKPIKTPEPTRTSEPIKTPIPTKRPETVKFKPYGVFLSVAPGDTNRIYEYETVVIDAQYFSGKDIKKLHDNGQKVYSYLNVGSVENFRSYYKEYEDLTLSDYENWEEERWVDVSSGRWQRFIVSKGKDLKEKGVDGFFIDNCDVYYIYKKQSIYNGLKSILEQLRKMDCEVIVNGGDTFVNEYRKKNKKITKAITGVNQETVFSSIDFDHNRFGTASAENHQYYKDYIRMCQKAKLDVFLLEYTKDKALKKKISQYCDKNGFRYYISDSIELD